MAVGVGVVQKKLEELEREITCGICQNHYRQPKVLPCLHYYCKHCILALRTGADKPFSCPECRKEATLPEGNVDQLQTAFFINRFKAAFSTLEKTHGKVEVKCEACTDSGAKAEAFCQQCAVFICNKCVESHQRLKIFDRHDVISSQDLKEGRAQDIIMKEPLTKKCPVHKEPLIVYCFDCNRLICRDCTVKDHRDHNFEFSSVAAPKTKEKLIEELKPLREVGTHLSQIVEEIQATKLEITAQGVSVANTIETSFQELHDILERHKNELVEESGMKVKKKMVKLLEQEKSLSTASAEVQSVLDYTEQCVRHCADSEIMSMHTEIRSRIEREIEEQGKLRRNMEPVEEVDVGVEVRCAEALQQLCQTNAKVTQLCIDPDKCTVISEGAKAAKVHQISDVILNTKLSNNKPTKRSVKIDCQLKSLHNRSVIKCKVDAIGAGEYRIQYTPTVRGRHELTLSVDGQQVAGSPFPVFVSIPPTQLGKPVWVLGDISKPTDVTVNSVGESIVTEYDGKVVMFDKQGKRLRSIERSEPNLVSVSFDDADNIYLVSFDTSAIVKVHRSGDIVQVNNVNQENGPGHFGVAAVGDEVMVCERHNKGAIMVYNRELKYMRQIFSTGFGELHDLSSDRHGNLYVTDRDNSCIRVFSRGGDFLRSFGCDGNGVKKLYVPCYVCVASQYVYVTDYFNDNVSVFTTEGEYVTSFGQRGSKIGDFSDLRGVCVDQDGFVYVCDYNNRRVQVF